MPKRENILITVALHAIVQEELPWTPDPAQLEKKKAPKANCSAMDNAALAAAVDIYARLVFMEQYLLQ